MAQHQSRRKRSPSKRPPAESKPPSPSKGRIKHREPSRGLAGMAVVLIALVALLTWSSGGGRDEFIESTPEERYESLRSTIKRRDSSVRASPVDCEEPAESKLDRGVFLSPDKIPDKILETLDVVLVLGGGVPSAFDSPPTYVKRRCDDTAEVVRRYRQRKLHQIARGVIPPIPIANSGVDSSESVAWKKKDEKTATSLPILCLSAGTAHMPQLLNEDTGLPIWESTASAAYLLKEFADIISPTDLYVETTSFDSIGNAFYARTSHTDHNPAWRNLLIVTNKFHMARSKAIFDWIYRLPAQGGGRKINYNLYYLSCPDTGLSPAALEARREKEQSSLEMVQTKLVPQYRSLQGVWQFLAHDHGLYTAKSLIERGAETKEEDNIDSKEEVSDLVKLSYGAK